MKFYFSFVLLLTTVFSFAQSFNHPPVEIINSPYDELNPVISGDGSTMFITRANHPTNVGGQKDPGDIWISALSETNQWSEPVHGGRILNDREFNGVANCSTDGRAVVLLSHYDPSGTARTQGISVSTRAGSEWSRPENITIPYFQNKSGALSGYINSDQTVFVFSAQTYGTRGVEDLYVSVKASNGKWGEPKNLGTTINTQFQELSPSLSADGNILYFSSNGRKGLGSFDVYSTTRLDDTWTNWSQPENLGPTINTEGRDLYYRLNPEKGLAIFTSTKNSDGYGDVKIFRSNEILPADTTSPVAVVEKLIPTVQPAIINDANINIYGKVTNAKTGETIKAKITFITAVTNVKKEVNVLTTGYSLSILSTNQYTVTIEAGGFISAMENLDINTYEMKALEMNFKLEPLEIGTTVNLKNVLFEQGKTQLLSGAYGELDLVIAFLNANLKVKIELSGHTDNRGIPAQNLKLSQARVDKIKSYLLEKGLDRRRITGKGYGGAKPIASNDTEETRQLNRRVEFTIKKL